MIRGPRAILALLTALNLVNYIDRFLIVAVSPKIKDGLALDAAQTGLIVSAFMLGYFLTSPLFGWLGDRFPRKGLIAGAVLVWSVATVASGFAESLPALLMTRVVVGVGEASYATLAPTIIDDISTPKTKSRWLAIFYVATPVGAALGFMLGGLLDHHYGWRNAFFIAGGPGVVLALLTLLIHEPKRTSARRVSAYADYAQLARKPVYISTVGGYIAQTFVIGGFTAWAAPYLHYKLCLDLHVADFWFGAITVVTGLAGTAIGGWLGDRWPGEQRDRAYLRVCAISSIAATPLALLALLMSTPTSFLIVLGLCELALFISVSPVNAAILTSIPTALRATAMAVSIFMMHLLGDLISPPLIGRISDQFRDSLTQCSDAVRGLQVGMYTLPMALAVSAVIWWYGSSPARKPSLDGPAAGV